MRAPGPWVKAQNASAALRKAGIRPNPSGHRQFAEGVIVQQRGNDTDVTVRYYDFPSKTARSFEAVKEALAELVEGGKPWVVTERPPHGDLNWVGHFTISPKKD